MTDVATQPSTSPMRQPGGVAVSQATAVEQSRAAAEVQAAVVVAQQVPRRLASAVQQMREACSRRALADRAFFRFSRGGGQVSGATVYLARELARCFGNFQFGVHELHRDDAAGRSEVMAWAWDVENNTRNSRTFIVPHARDTKSGRKPLTEMRDIAEMNSNMGARAVREVIFALLPEWFVQEAQDICNRTLATGEEGKPFAQQVADAIAAFADQHGVSQAQLEDKLGRPTKQWTPVDLAQLRVVHQSITRGEVTREEEFPQERVTAAEVLAARPARKRAEPAPQPATDDAPADPTDDVDVQDPPAEPEGWRQ